MGTSEPWANACFIAFTRQWVPEAAAAITALAAQVAELTRERDEARAERTQHMMRARDLLSRLHPAEAKVARLEGALRKIDALDDGAECCGQGVSGGYGPPECCCQPLYGLDRAKMIARAALTKENHNG
jgi:hypothetical protein